MKQCVVFADRSHNETVCCVCRQKPQSNNVLCLQMEATIKQAEEERARATESAKKLYEEYRPLKEEVDHMRTRLGLHPLTELQEEEEKLRPE